MRRIQLAIGVAIVAIALLWPILTEEIDAGTPDYFLEPIEYAPYRDATHNQRA
jgi:hypothetical protein